MSSTTAAFHPVANVFAHLPPEVWAQILRNMDIDTRLNMCEAAPELKSLVFGPTVMRIVRTDPETDFRTIEMFLKETRKELVLGNHAVVSVSVDVRELHFTNCVALPPGVIIDCVRGCSNLRELYCVGCVVEPAKLFVLLSTILHGLEKLEWSLHCTDYYESKLDAYVIGKIRSYRELEGPRLRSMYVEVAVTYATVNLLEAFWGRCSVLRNLHVHAILEKHPGTSSDVKSPEVPNPALLDLLVNLCLMQRLTTLKYSCQSEMPLKMEALIEQHEPVRMFSPQDLVFCNFVAIADTEKEERGVNLVYLSHVLTQTTSLRRFEQATVFLQANFRAASLFVQATASPEYCNHIQRLTLALSAPYEAMSTSHPAVMHKCYVIPMRRFFDTCVSKITELNMTAFHFGVDCDGCKLVASALPKLRALALPPCGVNLASSLQSLADGCPLLEHLDVKVSPFRCAASPCNVCQRPLCFTSSRFELLQKKTRLRRLSIDETAKIRNLEFLPYCRVEELRLSLDGVIDEDLAKFPAELGERLALNTRLSSLTLVARKVSLSQRVAKTLWQIQSLRRLCILTTVSHGCSVAEDFFHSLASRMPRLLSAHAHYVCKSKNVQSSWIRQRRTDCSIEPSEGISRTAQGVCLHDKPCLGRLCCVDTFIGLVPAQKSLLRRPSSVFVKRCPQVHRLHPHDVRTDIVVEPSAGALCAIFAPDKNEPLLVTDHPRYLQSFKYSCEAQLSPNEDARFAVIRNNIAWQRGKVGSRKLKLETAVNVVTMEDAVKQGISLRGFDQITVVLRGNVRAAGLFEEASSKPELWKDVTRVTFVYAPHAKN
ncbi:hypothetical protein MTO96_029790 [Rhipicephalus appendiculatus]